MVQHDNTREKQEEEEEDDDDELLLVKAQESPEQVWINFEHMVQEKSIYALLGPV